MSCDDTFGFFDLLPIAWSFFIMTCLVAIVVMIWDSYIKHQRNQCLDCLNRTSYARCVHLDSCPHDLPKEE